MPPSTSKPAHFTPSPRLVPRYVRQMARRVPNLLAPELKRYLEEANQHNLLSMTTAPVTDSGQYPRSPSLISSVEGKIAKILLTIPAYVVDDKWLEPIFKDLIRQLPADTDIVAVTANKDVTAAVKRWPDLDNGTRSVRWVESTNPLLFSMWAEDAYAAVKDNGTTYLVEPLEFFRYGDAVLAELIAKQQGIDIQQTQVPLYFQGGNILVGDDFVLIGEDYKDKTLAYVDTAFPRNTGETEELAVHRLYRHYLDGSRTISYVGDSFRAIPEWEIRLVNIGGTKWIEELFYGNWADTRQPIFHIDMFLTLAGRIQNKKYRVLVGDPGLAAQILGVPVWPHAMKEVFDDIATDLEGRQFEVIRNPLPMAYYPYEGAEAWTSDKVRGYVDQGVSGANDVLECMEQQNLKQLPARVWYFATANNALVQWQGPGQSDVWLPTYGHESWGELAATDNRNREIWESLDYRVHMLADFHPVAVRGGAAHCIKKYLDRQ